MKFDWGDNRGKVQTQNSGMSTDCDSKITFYIVVWNFIKTYLYPYYNNLSAIKRSKFLSNYLKMLHNICIIA